MDIIKWFASFLPRDPSTDCGYGPFKLPHDHPFTRICELHDYDFDNAKVSGQRLSEADWNLFWRFVLIAKAEEDPLDRCRLAMEICKIWSTERRVSRYLWQR